MTTRERIGTSMIVLLLVAALSMPFFAGGLIVGLLTIGTSATVVAYIYLAAYLLNNP